MSVSHCPASPSFTGFNTPSRIEADIADLAHEGTIPPELNGAFYRVQPDPQFPPRLGDHIAFNGADFAATKRPFNSLQDLAA
jgi:carotenoid cleavage dioxygenase